MMTSPIHSTDDCMNRPTLCDRNAVCSRTSAGDHVCICNPGYRGDGTTCTRKYTSQPPPYTYRDNTYTVETECKMVLKGSL